MKVVKVKVNGREIYIAPHREKLASEALSMDHTAFYTANTPCCLHLVNIHQTAWPLATGSSHLITALSTPRGWKAELALSADLQRTVYPYKWLPISCRFGADQWKFTGQRPTFYHWATQPTVLQQRLPVTSNCMLLEHLHDSQTDYKHLHSQTELRLAYFMFRLWITPIQTTILNQKLSRYWHRKTSLALLLVL